MSVCVCVGGGLLAVVRYCIRFSVTELLDDSFEISQKEHRGKWQWRLCSFGLHGALLCVTVSGDCGVLSLCDHQRHPKSIA